MPDTKLKAPKATDLLKEDHKRVKDLFDRYETLGEESADEKADIFEEVRRVLTIHATIEEEIFYPAVAQSNAEDAQIVVSEAEEEHKIVTTLLAELSEFMFPDEAFDAKMKVLRENAEHHANEEEKDMFPLFKKLPKITQGDISEQLRDRKADLDGGEEPE